MSFRSAIILVSSLLTLQFTTGKIQPLMKDTKFIEVFHRIIVDILGEKSSNVRVFTSINSRVMEDLTVSSIKTTTFEFINVRELSAEQKSRCNILSINSLEELYLILNSNMINFNGYFLVVLNSCSTIDSDTLFKASWQRNIYNIDILCRDNDTIIIKTFLPFQPDSCRNTSSIVLTHADKLPSSDFYPDKLKSLHGCPVRVVTFYYPPITMRETLKDNKFTYTGSEMDLSFGIAGALNFSINMTYIEKIGSSGVLLENGTATGIIKETIESEKELLLGFYYLTYLRTQYMSFTQSHYSIPLIIMIPTGEPYTAFEKLFRPFNNVVWIFLILTFSIAVVSLFIIRCQNKKIRKFIIGESSSNPYLNMIHIFVGGSLPVLPKRNFARTLLMIFMLFCLVQRSIYQSSLYLFLQSDGTKPPMTTIDEMMQRNFVFYIRETLEHNIRHMSFYNK